VPISGSSDFHFVDKETFSPERTTSNRIRKILGIIAIFYDEVPNPLLE